MAQDRILIVDDDPDARVETAKLLAQWNYAPIIAPDANDALLRLEGDGGFDLREREGHRPA